MGEIGLDNVVLALVGDVECSDCEVRLERFVFRVIQGSVGCIVPESGVFVSIMAQVAHVLNGVLSDSQV